VVVGYTEEGGRGYRLGLTKLSASGGIQWDSLYCYRGYDDTTYHHVAGEGVCQTDDGGFLVVGWIEDPPDRNPDSLYVLKVGASGAREYEKIYGVGTGQWIAPTSDGFILMGNHSSGNKTYLIKTDKSGQEVWWRALTPTSGLDAQSVAATSDGGYVVVGYDRYGNGVDPHDICMVKVDASGSILWRKVYGGDDHDTPTDVIGCSDHGFMIAGKTLSFGAGTGDYTDAYLIKTDKDGNLY